MDINIHYVEKGQGSPIILLHGNGEDSSYFESQIDILSDKYHVFALDSRGHGKTDFGEKELTIRQLAQDLDDFIEEKNLGKVDILGFSDGANIAMIYALDHPDKVGKLILNGGNLVPEGMIEKVYKAIKRHYDKALEDSDHDEEARKKAKLFSLMVNDPYIDKNDLKKIKNKALVIAGDKDMIRDDHTREIAHYLANSRLVILEGDHFVSKKKPEDFNKVMMEFLED
ncbi:MAG: alpha/beta hydrolase [Tissierellia bacterium]|nr:alpha/beta hydrolase [Tissierellia bacterium]